MPRPPADPYTPPPMHHDRSGAVVRIAMLAVLIAGAGFGWMYFTSHQQQTAGLGAPAAEEQQLADNSGMPVYQTNPTPAPEAAPAVAPAPVRRAAPARSAPAQAPREIVPPPTTTTSPAPVDSTSPSSTPTPLPPSDQGQ